MTIKFTKRAITATRLVHLQRRLENLVRIACVKSSLKIALKDEVDEAPDFPKTNTYIVNIL